MSKNTLDEAKRIVSAIQGWPFLKAEAALYILQGMDHFSVSSGPWTLTFDNTKESEVTK